MSVDIGWETITSGPDGAALADKIRAFVHQKFQQVTLPRFINAVHVHSFEFGSVCPEIEIKDICDPLPDFYEDDEDEENGDEDDTPAPTTDADPHPNDRHGFDIHAASDRGSLSAYPPQPRLPLPNVATGLDHPALRRPEVTKELQGASADHLIGPFPRSTTPGIPGGTSNLSYFHFPTGGLSGAQTPLAAVASGTPFSPRAWSHDLAHASRAHEHDAMQASTQARQLGRELHGHDDPSTRPSTANSMGSPRDSGSGLSSPQQQQSSYHTAGNNVDESALDAVASLSPLRLQSRQPSDLQVVARVKYSGDVRMTLTAEILLDYPMPSFVGIPLKLVITGMAFDGVAITAWIKKRMHFCFLDPEDAAALTGEIVEADQHKDKGGKDGARAILPGPLREIHVESEIGRKEDGKQVLKNVGKVEKFVLEQVRNIFEEEFVFPSYWTFLV